MSDNSSNFGCSSAIICAIFIIFVLYKFNQLYEEYKIDCEENKGHISVSWFKICVDKNGNVI